MGNGFCDPSSLMQSQSKFAMRSGIFEFHIQRKLEMRHRLIQYSLLSQSAAESGVQFRVVWLLHESASVVRHCRVQLAFLFQNAAQIDEGCRIIGPQSQGLSKMRGGFIQLPLLLEDQAEA